MRNNDHAQLRHLQLLHRTGRHRSSRTTVRSVPRGLLRLTPRRRPQLSPLAKKVRRRPHHHRQDRLPRRQARYSNRNRPRRPSRTWAQMTRTYGSHWTSILTSSKAAGLCSTPQFDGMILMWGRLAPGVSHIQQAQQELLSLTNELRKLYPAVIWDDERIMVTPARIFSRSKTPARPSPRRAARASHPRRCLRQPRRPVDGARSQPAREIQLRIDLGARRSRIFRQLSRRACSWASSAQSLRCRSATPFFISHSSTPTPQPG